MLAEALPKRLDQAAAMLRFFGPHLIEHLGGGRISIAKTLGEVCVNATVLLFKGYGQGEDLSLDQRASDKPCEDPGKLPRTLTLLEVTQQGRKVVQTKDQSGSCDDPAGNTSAIKTAFFEAHCVDWRTLLAEEEAR